MTDFSPLLLISFPQTVYYYELYKMAPSKETITKCRDLIKFCLLSFIIIFIDFIIGQPNWFSAASTQYNAVQLLNQCGCLIIRPMKMIIKLRRQNLIRSLPLVSFFWCFIVLIPVEVILAKLIIDWCYNVKFETFDLILRPDQRSTNPLQFRLEIIANAISPLLIDVTARYKAL